MHVLGYRVPIAVFVIAGIAAPTAAILFLLFKSRGTSSRQSFLLSCLTWLFIVIVAISLVPDSGRADAGICTFNLPTEMPWSSDQRLLNVLIYIPLGCLAVISFDTRRHRIQIGLLALAIPVAMELLQQTHLIGRSCDVRDVIDNWTGLIVGFGIGAVMARFTTKAST